MGATNCLMKVCTCQGNGNLFVEAGLRNYISVDVRCSSVLKSTTHVFVCWWFRSFPPFFDTRNKEYVQALGTRKIEKSQLGATRKLALIPAAEEADSKQIQGI